MKTTLLNLAKEAIASKLINTALVEKEALVKRSKDFAKPQATFVTLNLDGRLRGCIGSLVAHRDLYEDIVHNAQSAAFSDPRFQPLTLQEFERVQIEISLLSPAVLLPYETLEELKSKIKVGHHGVILKLNNNQATYLPQVWEQLNTFEQFFSSLCQKARLEGDCLKSHPLIYTYEVQKIK